MGQKIALGKAVTTGTAIVTKPTTLEEKVATLQKQVEELIRAFNVVNTARLKDKRGQLYTPPAENVNSDGVPIGLTLLGSSMRGGDSILTVYPEGYYLGSNKFDSLSAAAEYVSGVRRSGWTFWRTPDGKTLKEAFGKD